MDIRAWLKEWWNIYMCLKYKWWQVKENKKWTPTTTFCLIYWNGLFSQLWWCSRVKTQAVDVLSQHYALNPHYEQLDEELPLLPGHTVSNKSAGVLLYDKMCLKVEKNSLRFFPSVKAFPWTVNGVDVVILCSPLTCWWKWLTLPAFNHFVLLWYQTFVLRLSHGTLVHF